MHAKYLILLSLAAVAGPGCAEDPVRGSDPDPVPTDIGTATGAGVTASIGPEGGALSSADGVLSVVVPAGAVAVATEFGIQPITNHCFAGFGGAYRLTPDGAVFGTPVELHFAYTEEELGANGTVPAALGVAFQDGERVWQWQVGARVDEDLREVVLDTAHFTDFSRVYGNQLRADDDHLQFGESTEVHLLSCVAEPLDELGVEVGDLLPMRECADPGGDELSPLVLNVSTWAVNGAAGGTSGDGLLSGATTDVATYTAPSGMPSANPVAVSVETLDHGVLVANITVGESGWTGFSDVFLEWDSPEPAFTHTISIHAEVDWSWDETAGAYAPHGTLDYEVDGTYAPGAETFCTIFAQYTGTVTSGQLALFDLGTGTLQYAGLGYEASILVTEVDSCEGSTTLPTTIDWWPGYRGEPGALGEVTEDEDGARIEQTITFPVNGATQTNSYVFTKT
jgi:hypothetical protein